MIDPWTDQSRQHILNRGSRSLPTWRYSRFHNNMDPWIRRSAAGAAARAAAGAAAGAAASAATVYAYYVIIGGARSTLLSERITSRKHLYGTFE